jgi:hypothetical protein
LRVEYIATLEVENKVVWIKRFVTELEVVLSISKVSRSQHKFKHILRRYHLMSKYVNTIQVKTCKVLMDSESIYKDILTSRT